MNLYQALKVRIALAAFSYSTAQSSTGPFVQASQGGEPSRLRCASLDTLFCAMMPASLSLGCTQPFLKDVVGCADGPEIRRPVFERHARGFHFVFDLFELTGISIALLS